MGAVGDLGKEHVGPTPPHFRGRGGGEEVGIRAPDQAKRQARAGIEERPEIDRGPAITASDDTRSAGS